jgi:hypothetical protein
MEGSEPTIVRIVDEHEESPTGLGAPYVAKVSEHGLGHLLNPADVDDSSISWIELIWIYLLRQALDLPAPEPPWLDRPALSRVTASSPEVLHWFEGMNAGRLYRDQVKPSNFLLLAHPDPLDPSESLPVAPYESNPSKWADLVWIDRRSGKRVTVTTEPFDGTARSGTVRIRTYRDVIRAYLAHPESKSLGPRGERVTARTTGLLRRRPIEAVEPMLYIGKEGNSLDDRLNGLLTDPSDYRSMYEDPARTTWSQLVLPVLATMSRSDVVALSRLNRRTIERYLYRGMRPHKSHEEALTCIAVTHAVTTLNLRGERAQSLLIALHRYLQLADSPTA